MTEPHEFIITRGWGVKDTKWFWLCLTHSYAHGMPGCQHHLAEFMTVPVYDRQERLL